MALDRLTKIDGGGISTTSDYRVGIITASKFVGPFDGTGGNFSGVVTATNGVFSGNISAVDGNFSGNVTIGGTLTYEDVTNIDSVGIITAAKDIHVGAGVSAVGVGTFGSLDIGGDIDVDGHTNLDNVSVAGILTVTTSTQYHGYKLSNGSNLVGELVGLSGSNDTGALALWSGGSKYIQLSAQGNSYLNGGNFAIAKDLDVDGHTNLDNVSIAGITTSDGDIDLISNDAQLLLEYPGRTTGHLTANYYNRIVLSSNSPSTDIAFGYTQYGGNSSSFANPPIQVVKIDNGDKSLEIGNQYHGIGVGATINGLTGNATFSGIVTATTFSGSGASLTGNVVATGADINGDLDVDGHTNLDNVSVAGVSTFTGNVYIADSIVHSGDTNTYLQFPTGDAFNITTGGTQRFGISGTTGMIAIGDNTNLDSSVTITQAQGDCIRIRSNASSNTFKYGTIKLEPYNNNALGVQIVGAKSDSGYTEVDIGGGVDGGYAATQLYFWTAANTTTANGTLRWKIDSSGHFIPGAVGSYNIGSTSAEIGDVYLASSKKAYFGSTQTLSIHNDGNNSLITDSSSAMFIRSNRILFQNSGGTEGYGEFNQNGSVYWTHDNIKRIETTATGIEVTGEVAASQDYPNIRPVLDFNFAATKKLKPEMTFARQGEASFHDGVGSVKFVSDNEPRFEHDIVTGECKGLMFERAGTNYSHYSRRFDVVATGSWVKVGSASITANTYTAPDGTSSGAFMADTISGATGTTFNGNVLRQQITAGANVKHTFSIYIKLITSTQATIYIRDGATGSTSTANAISNTRNWQRVVVTSSAALTNATAHSFYVGNTNGDIAVWGAQIERSDYVTSYIKTDTNANGTRTADDGGVRLDGEDITDVFNQGEGTLIAELIPTESITNQGAVGFYQDFGSVNRIELRAQGSSGSTANARFESVVGSSSVVTMTGSPHAGINNVSKYAFAFQENNYASTVNGGTVQTDNSGAFPHGTGINSMIIGDSVYSQDASMIIKRIMYYADRLPNSQLVTLTS